MTTRAKKLLYIVAAITGMTLFIGAAAIWTIQDRANPFTLPWVVGIWMMIIYAITTLLRDYKDIDSPPPLKFRTDQPLLASEAAQAMAAGRDFKVSPDGAYEVTGKVLDVALVEGEPARWEIVIRDRRSASGPKP